MAKKAGDIRLTSFKPHGTENPAFDVSTDGKFSLEDSLDVDLEVKSNYEVRID